MLGTLFFLAEATPPVESGHVWGAVGVVITTGAAGVTALWRAMERRETARQAREDAREQRDAARMVALETRLDASSQEQLQREREDGRAQVEVLARSATALDRNTDILERVLNHLESESTRPRRNTK